ncbi:MAG: SLBB domain-containing protein [Candidatus Marinimicrobia bacterium]|nr:SLBB domain-containing protein [Candidatus Neomarinimicrobiota bacterium]
MKRIFYVLFILMFISTVYGQESVRRQSTTTGRYTDRPSASRYILSTTSDALLMTVKVWGEVQKPGLYDVPIGTDLIELISSTGGPTTSAKLSKVKIIHASDKNNESYVSTVNIKKFLDTGDSQFIPEIKPNDTIVVPIKPTQYIAASFSWTSQIINLIYIITMFDYYRSRP